MNIHEKYINRCMQLAENGLGTTYPNPLVGSVIVYENKIIGEGWHRKAGEAHAEVNAINSVADKTLLKKATIYVSLEPCSHFGKTPPCSDLIIASGFKKVVIGNVDPFEKVAGRGIKKLMDAGCEVQVGILEKKCSALNKRFFTFHQKRRPNIILKWAQSDDGFIAPTHKIERKPVWITNKYSNQLVHKWRSEEQAIVVGTNTAVADNPKLNTRLWKGKSPVRVLLDKNLRVSKDSALLDGSIKTIIIHDHELDDSAQNRMVFSENISYKDIDFEKDLALQICNILYQQGLQSVIIEGGTRTLQTFIDENCWDEARIFTGKIRFKNGIKAPFIQGKPIKDTFIGSDKLQVLENSSQKNKLFKND
ncbi:MAG: bifunctional diaminohydroxyphosphoribosylaminopyrimidine deaminase/5-amino-6-(5-phosphoribosylamino)uracil reductase RibD [Gillisia sp.]